MVRASELFMDRVMSFFPFSQESLSSSLAGDNSREAPPDPIPNSEVKLSSADGTAWVTAWESRSLPAFFRFFVGEPAPPLPLQCLRIPCGWVCCSVEVTKNCHKGQYFLSEGNDSFPRSDTKYRRGSGGTGSPGGEQAPPQKENHKICGRVSVAEWPRIALANNPPHLAGLKAASPKRCRYFGRWNYPSKFFGRWCHRCWSLPG